MPATVLKLPIGEKNGAVSNVSSDETASSSGKTSGGKAAGKASDQVLEALAQSAQQAASEKNAAAEIDRVEPGPDLPLEEAVGKEVRKGYDFLVIGVHSATAPAGGFHPTISRIARLYDGALAVVTARGRHERDPLGAPISILAPVTGNEVSRRGAEVAVGLAKAAEAPMTALSIVPPGAASERERLGAARRDATEVVKEIKAIAEFLETPIKSAIRTDISAEDAILRQARLGRHDLIVLGVSRRPGNVLSFGDLATAVLESSDRSLMFVAPSVAPRARGTAGGATAASMNTSTAA